MPELKYATTTTLLRNRDGLAFQIVRNAPWAADDPLVKMHPDFFVEEPLEIGHSEATAADVEQQRLSGSPRGHAPVEAATRAPGEVRKTS